MKLNFYKLFFVCFLFILLIILMFSFSLKSFTTHGIGDKNNDIWTACWYYWMTKDFVSSFPDLNFHTYKIFYPTGVNYFLYIPFTFNNFLSLLFIFIFNPVTTHNLMIFLSVFLNCIGMYLLANYLTGNFYASVVSGVIFGMHPYVLGQIFNGTIETVNMFWIPVYVWSLLKLTKRGNLKYIFITTSCLLFATLFSWYYGFYLIIFSFIYFLLQMFFGQEGEVNCRWKKYFMYSLLLYGIIITPIVYPFFKNVVFVKPMQEIHRSQEIFIVDIVNFFKTGKENVSQYNREFMKITYLGYIPLLLSFFAFWRGRKRRGLIKWVITGIVFSILTLGSNLKVNGKTFFDVPLPSKWFPLINTYRAFSIVLLSLSILVGYGVNKITEILKSKNYKNIATVIIIGLILSEFLILSPIPYPLPLTNMKVPEVYYKLAQDKEKYGIIEYPYDFFRPLYNGKYMYYQTVHQKYLPVGNSYIMRRDFWELINKNDILNSFVFRKRDFLRYPPPLIKKEIEILNKKGFKYIIVHHNELTYQESREINVFLRKYCSKIKNYPGGISLYKLR